MYDVVIIGGGISGMVCAITAARRGKSVAILEKNDKIGKKLLATGNGKCNLANADSTVGKYNTSFVDKILEQYPLEKQLAFYASLGVLVKEVDGRYFPYSEQASVVLNAMRVELDKLNVRVITSEQVTNVEKGFTIGGLKALKVVLATGSKATFGTESGYLYERFGHLNSKILPALVPILTSTDNIKGLRGVRTKVKLKLYVDNRYVTESSDEIIFKDNGVSGTAVFNVSQTLARLGGKPAKLIIDFMPDYTKEQIENIISDYGGIDGIFHKEIANNLIKLCGGEIGKLASLIKSYPLENARLGSMELAQVASGGLKVDGFDDITLESKYQKGLYAIGEVLDVDGECGGFNIMWACASGMAVGNNV
ncbi:MAG: aminoacetone oxidase family FAD-binding enzyme [Clostridia bacterium]|nr:aminoacetone oxidase family FAD-binding enzyme [Clostridia bacterium]